MYSAQALRTVPLFEFSQASDMERRKRVGDLIIGAHGRDSRVQGIVSATARSPSVASAASNEARSFEKRSRRPLSGG